MRFSYFRTLINKYSKCIGKHCGLYLRVFNFLIFLISRNTKKWKRAKSSTNRGAQIHRQPKQITYFFFIVIAVKCTKRNFQGVNYCAIVLGWLLDFLYSPCISAWCDECRKKHSKTPKTVQFVSVVDQVKQFNQLRKFLIEGSNAL